MNSNDAAVEVALLEIAKDLLQASDDLAPTDPSASAKLAHEAYEIGRDLGIVRNHLDPSFPVMSANSTKEGTAATEFLQRQAGAVAGGSHAFSLNSDGEQAASRTRDIEEDGDDELFRILDRQRAVVPNFAELTPTRKPSRNGKHVTFEVSEPRRSGWFSWMRSRDLRHAG